MHGSFDGPKAHDDMRELCAREEGRRRAVARVEVLEQRYGNPELPRPKRHRKRPIPVGKGVAPS